VNARLRLASASTTRHALLTAAGVAFTVTPARIDEEAVRAALLVEAVKPREIADALAELKARRVGEAHPEGLTLGADQVLDFDGACIAKSETPDDALALLRRLSGQPHILWSAAVIYEDGRPVWRHIGQARMRMRALSEAYLEDYLTRNWAEVRHSVGCYQIEAEGIRLFDSIGSDYHSILGLPMLPLLGYLATRGIIEA
jgi:septum formation protein